MQKVIAKIRLNNIRKNAEAFKRASRTKLCAVVKADAYGHGAEEVVAALTDRADAFAVALVDEALAIRTAACGKDILIFTPPTTLEEGYAIAANGFIASVDGLKTAKLLLSVCRKFGVRIRVHLKVNTGMNRYGMNGSMLGKVCKLCKTNPCLQAEGLYSHLCGNSAEEAEEQRRLFLRLQRIAKGYFPSFISHLGATYGATLGENFSFDMLRVGLGLYGYSPAPTSFPLYKGMTVTARAVTSRKYSFGGVGYGQEQMKKGETLTVCRVGYADGFLRKKQNGTADSYTNATGLCMDVCIKRARKRGEIPVLIDAAETAKEADTIPYEVLCAATRRAERIYE